MHQCQCSAVMATCRVSRLLSGLAVAWILLSQGATAMPDMSKLESKEPLPTPGVTFYMYPTPAAADSPVTENIGALLQSQPLTLVMHGFKGDSTAKSMLAIKQALLLSDVQNVVMVDWGSLSDATNTSALTAYHHVRDHGVPTAAKLVADWLRRVIVLKDISPDQVHLVGFSLGAHLAAIVGRHLNSTLGRITALDPPKFGYLAVPVHQRLDSSAAKFVNVIHTSSGVLSYPEPIGHVDFFPNGDALPQPGCPTESPIHIITCSHYMSFVLFAESVLNEKALMATECGSWLSYVAGLCGKHPKVPMGYATPNTTRGIFYMKTNESPPFGTADPNQHLPEEMKTLLVYDETDTLIDPLDVVNFFANKEPLEESSEVNNSLVEDSSQLEAESERKVMRVKSGRSSSSGTSTTEAPPAFQNSCSSINYTTSIYMFLIGMIIRHY